MFGDDILASIFIIEDDVKIRNELTKLLEKYGYECESSDDFQNIVEIIMNDNPNLVLLDINLPVFDGYYLCREIRRKSQVPIIIVTSRDSEVDELMSMNLGADDFITKPYNTQILLARISSVLKRVYNSQPKDTINHKGVQLNISKSMVEYNGKSIELSKNEVRILHLLMQNKDHIVSRDEIMNDLWQSEEFVDDNTLTVNINRLRKKLEEIGVRNYLITKRGQGYMV
jgi:DNA-binding response OmpR family regulator